MNNKVQVGICLRPLVKSEVESGAEIVIKVVGGNKVVVSVDSPSTRYDSVLLNTVSCNCMFLITISNSIHEMKC